MARVDPLLSVSVRGVPCPVDLVLEGMQPAIVSIALEGGGVQPTRPKAATSGFGRAPERRRSICGEGAAARAQSGARVGPEWGQSGAALSERAGGPVERVGLWSGWVAPWVDRRALGWWVTPRPRGWIAASRAALVLLRRVREANMKA